MQSCLVIHSRPLLEKYDDLILRDPWKSILSTSVEDVRVYYIVLEKERGKTDI